MLFKQSNTLVIGILVLFFLISCNSENQKNSEFNQTNSSIKKKPNRMTVLSPRIPTSPKKFNSELLDDSCFTINTVFAFYILSDWEKYQYHEVLNNRTDEIYYNGRDIIIRYTGFLKKYGKCDIIIIFREKLSKSCLIVSKHKGKQSTYYTNLSRNNVDLIVYNIDKYCQSFENYQIEVKPQFSNEKEIYAVNYHRDENDRIMYFKDIRIIEKKTK